MKFPSVVALFLLMAGAVHAQGAPLDLELPPQAAPAAGSSSDVASDPPDTYYGDGSALDPKASTTLVSGGVTTGVGYSREFGTGTSIGADLDASHVDADGRSMNLHIDVSRSDGFPGQSGYIGQFGYDQPGYLGGYPARRN